MLLMPGDVLYGADPRIDGGQRVSMGRVLYPTMRTQDKTRYWSPHFNHHGLFFYGEREETIQDMMTSWVRSSVGAMSKHSSLMILDRNDFLRESVERAGIENISHFPSNTFIYRNNSSALSTTVDEIMAFRDNIRQQLRERRMVNAANRRGLVLAIVLDDTDVFQFNMFTETIEDMMDSTAERIYPVIIAKNSTDFPVDFIRSIGYTLFFGADNENHCLNTVFSNDDYLMSSVNKYEEVGLHRMVNGLGIEPVAALKNNLSDWHIATEEYEDEAEAAYKALLSAMDDGT